MVSASTVYSTSQPVTELHNSSLHLRLSGPKVGRICMAHIKSISRLEIHRLLMFKIIKRHYFALRSMAEQHSLTSSIVQACINSSNIKVAIVCLRVDPCAQPAIFLSKGVSIIVNERCHFPGKI